MTKKGSLKRSVSGKGRSLKDSGPYKTKLWYNRKGIPDEIDLDDIPSPAKIPAGSIAQPVKNLLAEAVKEAMDRMETFYLTLDRAREVSGGGRIVCDDVEARAMLSEVEAAAKILQRGLQIKQ